jgi:hypothetical protein
MRCSASNDNLPIQCGGPKLNTIRNLAVILFLLLGLAASSLVLAQAPDIPARAGAMNRPAGLAALELTLARAGEGWKAT